MTSREKLPKKSLTRSVRLKKYEAVYKRLICKVTKPKVTKPKVTKPKVTKPKVTKPKVTKPKVTKPKVTKPKVTKPKVTKPKVKITKSRSKLTDYQKYVRIESKRLKYKKLVPSARLGAIGAAWMEDRCK